MKGLLNNVLRCTSRENRKTPKGTKNDYDNDDNNTNNNTNSKFHHGNSRIIKGHRKTPKLVVAKNDYYNINNTNRELV